MSQDVCDLIAAVDAKDWNRCGRAWAVGAATPTPLRTPAGQQQPSAGHGKRSRRVVANHSGCHAKPPSACLDPHLCIPEPSCSAEAIYKNGQNSLRSDGTTRKLQGESINRSLWIEVHREPAELSWDWGGGSAQPAAVCVVWRAVAAQVWAQHGRFVHSQPYTLARPRQPSRPPLPCRVGPRRRRRRVPLGPLLCLLQERHRLAGHLHWCWLRRRRALDRRRRPRAGGPVYPSSLHMAVQLLAVCVWQHSRWPGGRVGGAVGWTQGEGGESKRAGTARVSELAPHRRCSLDRRPHTNPLYCVVLCSCFTTAPF